MLPGMRFCVNLDWICVEEVGCARLVFRKRKTHLQSARVHRRSRSRYRRKTVSVTAFPGAIRAYIKHKLAGSAYRLDEALAQSGRTFGASLKIHVNAPEKPTYLPWLRFW